MNKNTRNIIIAVILLVILLVAPFRWKIMAAIKGEDAETGASPESGVSCTVEINTQEGEIILEQTKTWGETALDALQNVCDEAGMLVETSGSPAYVTSIGGVSEGDGGASSGWMYAVNGENAMVSAEKQTLSEGDAVVWTFVTSWN